MPEISRYILSCFSYRYQLYSPLTLQASAVFLDLMTKCAILFTLQWRHNGHDSVSYHQPYDCLLNRLFGRRSKKTSKLRVTGLCAGNSPGTGEVPALMASYAANVSIWWRHHEPSCYRDDLIFGGSHVRRCCWARLDRVLPGGLMPLSTALGQHTQRKIFIHDDVIKWRHFPRYWPFVRGTHRPSVNSPHKNQWRVALMFPLICAWTNGCANNREAGDLRHHCAHYDVTVMNLVIFSSYEMTFVSSKSGLCHALVIITLYMTLRYKMPCYKGVQIYPDVHILGEISIFSV